MALQLGSDVAGQPGSETGAASDARLCLYISAGTTKTSGGDTDLEWSTPRCKGCISDSKEKSKISEDEKDKRRRPLWAAPDVLDLCR